MAKLAVDISKLKQFMAERNISAAKLARKTGLSRSTISRVLKSKRGTGARFIGCLADAYPDVWDEGIIFLAKGSQTVTDDLGQYASEVVNQ